MKLPAQSFLQQCVNSDLEEQQPHEQHSQAQQSQEQPQAHQQQLQEQQLQQSKQTHANFDSHQSIIDFTPDLLANKSNNSSKENVPKESTHHDKNYKTIDGALTSEENFTGKLTSRGDEKLQRLNFEKQATDSSSEFPVEQNPSDVVIREEYHDNGSANLLHTVLLQ